MSSLFWKNRERDAWRRNFVVSRRISGVLQVWNPLCVIVIVAMLFSQPAESLAQAGGKADRQRRKLLLLKEKRVSLYARLSSDLEKLAAWCDERSLTDAATATRLVAKKDSQSSALVDVTLPKMALLPIDRKLPDDEYERRQRLRKIRERYATEIYRLSREGLRGGFPAFAMELVKETALHDPDHKNARRILGYQAYFDPMRKSDRDYAGEWVSPFAARQLAPPKRHVWDDRFGWIPRAHIDQYEKGQRFWKGRWITAEREAEYRRDFKNAWEIRTDHYLVKTNYSQQRGVEVAQALERYHDFFKRTMTSFFSTPEELEKRFLGRREKAQADKPYVVHYYASRDEYNRRLIGRIPQIAMTNGLYHHDQVAYFFHDPEAENDSTLFHEATHQILDFHSQRDRSLAARALAAKRRQRVRDWVIAEKSNFWVVEGIACYMESFQEEGGRISIGNRDFSRFATASLRMQAGGYYLPMEHMSAMGRDQFQADRNITKNYTQASGFVHFLVHYQDGIYRDALVKYITELYRPRLDDLDYEPSLARLTGVPFEVLDQQYRNYMLSWGDDAGG